MENKFNRPEITVKEIVTGIKILEEELSKEVQVKGSHAFVSTHEIVGVIQEEMDELREATHNNNNDDIEKELMDVMISAFWGYVSFVNGKCDW